MISLETLDLISTISWKAFEKVNKVQERFWLNKPIRWNSKTKHASYHPIKKCLPLLFVTSIQVLLVIYSFVVVYWQSNPKYADPRFPFAGVALTIFCGTMNTFITIGSFANFYKRKEWALTLNVIAYEQFHSDRKSKRKNSTESKIKTTSIWRGLTLVDIVTNGIAGLMVVIALAGFTMPILSDVDILAYCFIDVDHKSWLWYISKYGIRSAYLGMWSCYGVWTFYNVVASIFFIILHSLQKIPRVPKDSKSQKLSVVPNSISNLKYTDNLVISLMEGAYKEYREFQVFMRPANDAAYIVIPDGISGISLVSIIAGFATIKGSSKFSVNVYVIFPCVFCLCMSLILFMIPIACGVFESAVDFKRYWLSRFKRMEVRKRLIALRPMGIAAGPFGYVDRCLPMVLSDSIIDFICSLSLSFSL